MAKSVVGISDIGFLPQPAATGASDRLPPAQAVRWIIVASMACWALIIPAVTMLV